MPSAATTLVTLFDRFGWLVAIAIATFASIEIALLARRGFVGTNPAEVLSNLVSHGIGTGLRAATRSIRVSTFAVAASLSPCPIETTWLRALVAYLAIDLILYLWHRMLHETEFGWAFHSVHHSSAHYDLSIGARASWLQRIADDVIYVPVVLAGFDPAVVFVLIDLNRLSQLWTHTESIGRLPVLDAIVDTPSNHRVHHRCDRAGRARNYGSTFVIWDRLFGTYEPERERTGYGLPFGELGPNPFVVQLAGFSAYVSSRWGGSPRPSIRAPLSLRTPSRPR